MNFRKEFIISAWVRRYQDKATKLRNITVAGFTRYLENGELGVTVWYPH